MNWEILEGDCREVLASLPERSVQTCVTSPPYFGLRDYGAEGQIGLEPSPDEYVAGLVAVFREVHRVLRDDGTVWLNYRRCLPYA
jgi:DNA modification methylase